MRNQILTRQLQLLNHLFRQTSAVSGYSIEMQAHWAKYLCVLSAGFLENAIGEIFIDYVKIRGNEEIVSYTTRQLSRIRNPKTDKFITTARAFRKSWAEELTDYVEENGRKDAIDSIMANRNQIAHGKNSGITVARLRDWLDKSIEVVEYVESQLNP